MDPRRIAVVRLSAIGDVVHGLPLAGSLRRLYPRAKITWIVQPGPAPLLVNHPFVDDTLIYPRHGGPLRILRFLWSVRFRHFDLAVDLQGNLKSGLVLANTLAPRRVGLAREEYREKLGALAAKEHAELSRGPHSVDRTLALCRKLGDLNATADYGLSLTEEELDPARADLAEIPDPAIALSVGSQADVREWTDEGYVAAAGLLAAEGVGVIMLSGPDHAGRCERIAARADVPARAGTTDLRGLLAHLAVLAERGGALIACDSAPVHLAVAVKLPVVTLSGPQDPRRTGPYGFADRAVTAWGNLRCAPCLKRTCALKESPRACMKRIEPAEVARRALALLRG